MHFKKLNCAQLNHLNMPMINSLTLTLSLLKTQVLGTISWKDSLVQMHVNNVILLQLLIKHALHVSVRSQ
jgi:hypothetical protein